MASPRHFIATARPILRHAIGIMIAASAVTAASTTRAHAQALPPNPNGPQANWALFEKFSTANARLLTYSTTVTPRWIGQSDSLFYSWRDHTGEHWYLVNAATRTGDAAEIPVMSSETAAASDGPYISPQTFKPCRGVERARWGRA